MISIGVQYIVGCCITFCLARNTIGYFVRCLPGFLLDNLSLDHKGLTDVGGINITIQMRGHPYFSGFYSPMPKIGFWGIG
jgi:hypothetical protein